MEERGRREEERMVERTSRVEGGAPERLKERRPERKGKDDERMEKRRRRRWRRAAEGEEDKRNVWRKEMDKDSGSRWLFEIPKEGKLSTCAPLLFFPLSNFFF
jgi:hypothetical protein